MATKYKRPKVPPDVMLKLWVLSGGRCELPRCNRVVWKDGITLKQDNFAHLAHIVAASPDGPRGDKILSPKLAKDASNLMLLCLTHSRLVDGPRYRGQYSVETLLEYKKKHEDRIRIQTSIAPEKTTTVMTFVAAVRDRVMVVPTEQTHDAIMPERFPYEDKGIAIDFSIRSDGNGEEHWKSFIGDIDKRLDAALLPGNDHHRVEHLSVFAIASIPLLVYLGNKLGGVRTIDFFQKHRDTENWTWQKEPRRDTFKYIVKKGSSKKGAKQVALILSLSSKIDPREVSAILPEAPWYEIAAPKPDRDYLKRRSQLTKFAAEYRQLLEEIKSRYGNDCEICLFPAAPVSVALSCGRELLPKADPHLVVYDRAHDQGGFVRTLKIN